MNKLGRVFSFFYLFQAFSTQVSAAAAVDLGLFQDIGRGTPIRYGLTSQNGRYNPALPLDNIRDPLFFHDQTTGESLGRLDPLGNELTLIWGHTPLLLNNTSSFFKKMTIRSEGDIEWSNVALANTDIAIAAPTFVTRGHFLAHSLFVNAEASNFGILDTLALTCRGSGFHGHPGSTTLGRVRFDVDLSGSYTMEGEAASLYQTVHAKNASFKGARPFTGVFWDVQVSRATFGASSRLTLFGGGHIHTKRDLDLGSHFQINNGPDPLSQFFEGSLESPLTPQDRIDLAPVVEMGLQQTKGTLRATSDGKLTQTGDIRIGQGDVVLTGKRVDIEGTQRSQSEESQLKIKATTLIRLSGQPLSRVSLQAPEKLLEGDLHLETLVSKTGTIIFGAKGTIGKWTSVNEEISSSGDLAVDILTLNSPTKAAFSRLTSTHLKVQNAQSDVYIGNLVLRGVASIEANQGEILVANLVAPGTLFKAVADRITLLNSSQAGDLNLTSHARDLILLQTVARTLKAHAEEGHLHARDLTYEIGDLKGRTMSLRGAMKGPNLTVVATQGSITSTATFQPNTSLKIKTASMTGFQSMGPLKHLDLTLARLDALDWINGSHSLHPETLSIQQTSTSAIDLSGRSVNLDHPEFHLRTPGPFHMPGVHFASQGDVNLDMSSLYAPHSTLDVRNAYTSNVTGAANLAFARMKAGTFHLKVGQSLSAQGSHLESPGDATLDVGSSLYAPRSTLNVGGTYTADVAGNTNLDFAHLKAGSFHLKVKETLSAQGIQVRGVRALEVVAKTINGAALKEHKGNWNYEYDVLTARPEFICENGPLVVLAEQGLWLEVPILQGASVMFGSLRNNASVTPLTFETVRRWVEEHKKKGGVFRRSKTTRSEHRVSTQTVVQPEILSRGDLTTQAPHGILNLHAAKVLVAGNWTIVAKTFGMKAATALQERYSKVSRSSRSGFGINTSSTSTSFSSTEETVPPIMQIGGNLYMYCDEAHFEAIQGFVNGDTITTAQKVTLGAHVTNHHQESHATSKGPFVESRSGMIADATRSTLSHLETRGGLQASVGSVVEVTTNGPLLPEGVVQGATVVYRAAEHSDSVTTYSHTKQTNQEVLGTVMVATTIAGGVAGGTLFSGALLSKISAAVVAGAVGPGISMILQDQRFDGTAMALSIGKGVATAAISFGVASALELPAHATTFSGHVQRAAVDQTVHATVDIATGEDIQATLRNAGLSIVAQSVGASLANELAVSYHTGDIGCVSHKAGHFAIGAAMGTLTGGKEAAISGGIGAVVAEVAVEALVSDEESFETFAKEHPDLPPQEAAYQYLQERQPELLAPRLLAVAIGGLIGKDPQAASTAASNALENNWSLTIMMEAEYLQGLLAKKLLPLSTSLAEYIKGSSGMRDLCLLLAEIRKEIGLSPKRPLLKTYKDEGEVGESFAGQAFLRRHPDIRQIFDPEKIDRFDYRYDDDLSDSLEYFSKILGVSQWPQPQEVSAFLEDLGQKLRARIKDIFTIKEGNRDQIQDFFDGPDKTIMGIKKVEDMPTDLRGLIPKRDLESIQAQHRSASSSQERESVERLNAYQWVLEKQTSLMAQRREQCREFERSGFALSSARMGCGDLPFSRKEERPTKMVIARASIEKSRKSPQTMTPKKLTEAERRERIMAIRKEFYMPPDWELLVEEKELSRIRKVCSYTKGADELSYYERTRLAQDERQCASGYAYIWIAKEQKRIRASQGISRPAHAPIEGPLTEEQRQEAVMAIQMYEDLPSNWEILIKKQDREDSLETWCAPYSAQNYVSPYERKLCQMEKAYSLLVQEQEEIAFERRRKQRVMEVKSSRDIPEDWESVVREQDRQSIENDCTSTSFKKFCQKQGAYAAIIREQQEIRAEQGPTEITRVTTPEERDTSAQEEYMPSDRESFGIYALDSTEIAADSINAIGSAVEQASQWCRDFAERNPTTASFLVETLKGAQYAGEAVLVTTSCTAGQIATPAPCIASLAFVMSNHSGFTEYAIHQAAEGFTPLLNAVPGVNPVYGENTSKALSTGLSFLGTGKLVSTVTKIGAPIGYGIPALNREIIKIFDVNRGHTVSLLAAEEVSTSTINGFPLMKATLAERDAQGHHHYGSPAIQTSAMIEEAVTAIDKPVPVSSTVSKKSPATRAGDGKGARKTALPPTVSRDFLFNNIMVHVHRVGEKKTVRLFDHFESGEALLKATKKDLLSIKGISESSAEAIFTQLRNLRKTSALSDKLVETRTIEGVRKTVQESSEKMVKTYSYPKNFEPLFVHLKRRTTLSNKDASTLFNHYRFKKTLSDASTLDIQSLTEMPLRDAEILHTEIQSFYSPFSKAKAPLKTVDAIREANPFNNPLSKILHTAHKASLEEESLLLKHFGSEEALLNASVSELQEALGIPRSAAEVLHKFMGDSGGNQ